MSVTSVQTQGFLIAAVVRGHEPDVVRPVHLPELLPHRTQRQRLQPCENSTSPSLQLDARRDALPGRVQGLVQIRLCEYKRVVLCTSIVRSVLLHHGLLDRQTKRKK